MMYTNAMCLKTGYYVFVLVSIIEQDILESGLWLIRLLEKAESY